LVNESDIEDIQEEFEQKWWYSRPFLRTIFFPLLYLTSWEFRLWNFLRQPPEVRKKKVESEAKKIRRRFDFPTVKIEDILGRERELKQVMLSIKYHVFRDKDIRKAATAVPPKLFLVKGSSGTGKTYFAEALMRWAFEEGLSYGLLVNFSSLKPEDVYTMWYGQSAQRLSDFFNSAFIRPSVIFVDEFQAFGKKFSATSEAGMEETRVQTVFLEKIDELMKRNYRVVLLIATTEYEALLDTIRRRGVVGTIDLDAGVSSGTLLKIVEKECEKHKINLNPKDVLSTLEESVRIVGNTTLTPADIVNAFNMIVNKKMQELSESSSFNSNYVGNSITLEDFRWVARFLKSYSQEARTEAAKKSVVKIKPKETYKDVGGLKGIKEEIIKELSLALNPDLSIRAKYVPPKGFIFYGPPGTGKTLLAKAIAHENNVWFYSVNGPSIIQGIYGDPEKTIRNIFEDARKNAPAIVFFDEIDSIVPRRGTTDPVLDRVTSQLLTELDGFVPLSGVVVIGATNRIEVLDPALLERFSHRFEFTYPKTREEKLEVISIHLSKYLDVCDKEVSAEKVYEILEGKVLSPRRIAEVINEANRLRAKELDAIRAIRKATESNDSTTINELLKVYSQEIERISELFGTKASLDSLIPLLKDVEPSNYPLRLFHFKKAVELSSEESVEEMRKMIERTVRTETPEVGKAYGLVAVGEEGTGGFVAAIETVVSRNGNGKVKVIGSEVGESVQASAEDAFIYLNSISDWRYKNCDVFVELVTPAKGLEKMSTRFGTAAPVSGPSAGLAIAVALISSITKLKVDPSVVMTGAITARGEVWPVGGLDYRGMGKIEAALADKYVKKLIIPKYNLEQLIETKSLEPLNRAGIVVKGVSDVLEAAAESIIGLKDKDSLINLIRKEGKEE
jgi:SpoVK/Ycf46/Vps4 family AAA+-type ATPase